MFFENFRVALRALSANKLRAILTMLGIIIGVGSVVALMALGNGATASITEQVQGIGSNLIAVYPGQVQRGGAQSEQSAVLYYEDYVALEKNLTDIVGINPVFQSTQRVAFEDQTVQVSIIGTNADYPQVNSFTVERGTFFSEAARTNRSRVAVLGSQTATDLFGGLDPIGRRIKINGVLFQVIGVFESKGSSGFGSQDERIVIPLETGYDKIYGASAMDSGKHRIATISISAANADVVDRVMGQAERILRYQRKIAPGKELDVTVLSQNSLLETLQTITATLTAFLGAIAAISLLVGGIGIMNIMLVSVTERTKEIGLRKAVGATRFAILLQFLVETLILSLLGGLIGIGLGMSIAGLVTLSGAMTALVTIDSIILAFSFAAAVGLFFGMYPAWRAANLRPIEALRYE